MQTLLLLAALGQFPLLNQLPAGAWPSFRQPSTQTAAPQVNPPPLAEPGDGLLVMAFTSTWCAPCARIKPALQTLQAEGIAVQYVDYDTDRHLALAYNVTTLPTTIVLERGIEIHRRVGVVSLDQLRALIPHRSPQPPQAQPTPQQPEIPPSAIRPAPSRPRLFRRRALF